MRRLSSSELTNGMFVQCLAIINPVEIVPVIYQIIIKEDKFFYTSKDSDWEIPGDLVKDNWYETELTKSLNRQIKLEQLGI